MIKEKMRLIPRYNWDYGLTQYANAIKSLFKSDLNGKGSLEKIFGQKPIYTTSGGTSLYIILKSLNLPKGSIVGVPLYCCPVVFEAIIQADLIPKFIDINADDYNLSVPDLKKKIKHLSAVVAVHMFGNPADMDSIKSVCGDIPVIEDCAHSLFSKYKGQYTGLLSTASFFSFRIGKYISAGHGSAIFCKDPILHKSIKELSEKLVEWKLFQEIFHCGMAYVKSALNKRPLYGILGYHIGRRLDRKLDLTDYGSFELKKIAKNHYTIINDRVEEFHEKISKQRKNAFYLLENLRIDNVILPNEKNDYFSNYYQFAIRFQNKEQRDWIADYLFKHGIEAAKYLGEIADTARKNYNYNGDCPIAETCAKTILVVPHYYTLSNPDLKTIEQRLSNGIQLLKSTS